MSSKNNKAQNKELPAYAKIIAAAVVGVLILVAVFGTVGIVVTYA